jgi:hypothetical protein
VRVIDQRPIGFRRHGEENFFVWHGGF